MVKLVLLNSHIFAQLSLLVRITITSNRHTFEFIFDMITAQGYSQVLQKEIKLYIILG